MIPQSYTSNMRHILSLYLILFAGILVAESLPSHPYVTRGGLPNTFAKLEEGGAVTVVFIGGSITRGGGEAGYVASTEAWLRETWPDADITVVNAGISGTDSNFGAKRFDRDVLVHNPDLVLIEFAVNDGQADHTVHMERMVHKTWKHNPSTDLAFFYTLSRGHLDDYRRGVLPRAAGFHERVAIHYNIPTIGLAHAVAEQLESGKIEWQNFANDAVHPHAGGYRLFNEVFQEVLPRLFRSGTPGPHKRIDPLTENLQVYPPPIEVIPQDVPHFSTADGQRALHSFAAPTPGVHWAEDPVFSTEEGKTLWRLHWIPKQDTAAMDERTGSDKTQWAANLQRWFAEERAFTGEEGNSLYGLSSGGTQFGFSGQEAAVMVFVAPETGTYAWRIGADRLNAWRNEDTEFALHVLYFPWGERTGTSRMLYRAKRKNITPFKREGIQHLTAGEEFVIVAASNTPGHVRGGWHPFQLHIGLMERE
jgi:lysophospholipase L1-like esterase